LGIHIPILLADEMVIEMDYEDELIDRAKAEERARIVQIVKNRIKELEKYRKMADESNQKTEEGWFYERLGELDSLLNNIE